MGFEAVFGHREKFVGGAVRHAEEWFGDTGLAERLAVVVAGVSDSVAKNNE